jgi:uncharacterized delta-60 repeat protein
MALADVAITLNINNNVSYPIDINVLGNPANLRDNANATTQYRYNVTGFTFTNETNVIIQYKAVGASTFSTFTQQLQSQNIQGVINALNLLGIGSFQTYTQAGQTYISTYNNNFVFGQINIYSESSIISPTFFYGTGFNQTTFPIIYQSDGKILIGYTFTSYNGTAVNRIVRLNTDGSIDTSFVTGTGFGAGTSVNVLNIQSDGKILVGGTFTSYNGTPANNIIRLNSDGSVDNTFITGTGFSTTVDEIVIQSDGNIICGGGFLTYNGTGANRIIRLQTNGSVDPTFVYGTGFNFNVTQAVVQSDGKIIVVGGFTSYNGTGASRIIRLNSNGSVDPTFVYGTGFLGGGLLAICIALQSNGTSIVGGDFTSYNGTGANNVVSLNTNGSINTSFVYGTGFDTNVRAFIIQPDGKIIVGGTFSTYNGTGANNIIRLNPNGSVDTSWNYGTGFNSDTYGLDLLNGKLIVTGVYTSFNGITANRIIQLLT